MARRQLNERIRSSSDRRWRELAAATAADFQARLGATRYLHLDERDRARVARRLREAIDVALEVTDETVARAAARAAALHGADPAADAVHLAWSRTRERARRTAAIGTVTTLPAMVPGLGTALAALGLVADWRYVAEQQRDLVLETAALLGAPLREPTAEVRSIFIAGAAAAFGERTESGAVVRQLAEHLARRSVARVVPGAGAVVTSALNYLGTAVIGRVAIVRFARRAGLEIAPLIPARTDPELPHLEQTIVAAIRSAISGEEVPPPLFGAEQRAALGRLSRAERESLFDLAVVSAASQGGVSAEEQRVLAQIGDALGFPVEHVLGTISLAQHDVTAFGVRFRALLDSSGDSPDAVTRLIWRRTRALARGPGGTGDE